MRSRCVWVLACDLRSLSPIAPPATKQLETRSQELDSLKVHQWHLRDLATYSASRNLCLTNIPCCCSGRCILQLQPRNCASHLQNAVECARQGGLSLWRQARPASTFAMAAQGRLEKQQGALAAAQEAASEARIEANDARTAASTAEAARQASWQPEREGAASGPLLCAVSQTEGRARGPWTPGILLCRW